MLNRNSFLRVVAAAFFAALSAAAAADATYPTRAITLVSSTPVGSSPDNLVRVIAEQMKQILGQPVVVDSRPGANMQVATQAVSNARPDGYTVLVVGNAAVTVNQHLFKTLGYEPAKSFEPVTAFARGGYVWIVNPKNVPAKTIPELMRFVKDNPEKVSFAESSPVTTALGKMIERREGVKFYWVPYRTAAQALPDLLSGRLDMALIDISVMQHVQNGALRALGWSDSKRTPLLPDMPTIEEGGLAGAHANFWIAAYTPAGTPAAVNEKLAAAIAKASQAPEVRRALQFAGTHEYLVPLKNLAELQAAETQRWGSLIRAAGIEMQ